MRWELVSQLLNSSRKMRAMQVLHEHNTLDRRSIARLCELERANARKTIKVLCEQQLVECLTPNQVRSKIYRITPFGADIFREAQRLWPDENETRT